jgi:3-methyladenine DNA glycosylase Tag
MDAPPQITPKSLDDYLEQLSRGVFQAGISWRVVDAKWPGIREAFHRFSIERVARMNDREIDKLTQDQAVIRSRPKIAAVVHNARVLLELERERGFRKYLRSFDDYESLASDLKKRMKFVGDSGAYHFLYTVKHPVPEWHAWAEAHGMTRGMGRAKSTTDRRRAREDAGATRAGVRVGSGRAR